MEGQAAPLPAWSVYAIMFGQAFAYTAMVCEISDMG